VCVSQEQARATSPDNPGGFFWLWAVVQVSGGSLIFIPRSCPAKLPVELEFQKDSAGNFAAMQAIPICGRLVQLAGFIPAEQG
jgi:hypothetical protein